jgi:hypothetical protein
MAGGVFDEIPERFRQIIGVNPGLNGVHINTPR